MKKQLLMEGCGSNLLIFESGLQLSREYWLKDFIDLGYNLFLAQPWPVTWEQPYIEKYLQIHFNPWTQEEKNKLIQFISENNICGIICLNEGSVPFASDIIEMVGFPCTPKGTLRSLFEGWREIARRNGLKYIFGGSRIPGLINFEYTPEVYLQKVKDKSLFDPVLSKYMSCNLKVGILFPNYFNDPESRNFGVEVYDVID